MTAPWMGGEPALGETFVQGRDRDTARALLAGAGAEGLDPSVVRAVPHGFIVPSSVYDAAYPDTTSVPAEF